MLLTIGLLLQDRDCVIVDDLVQAAAGASSCTENRAVGHHHHRGMLLRLCEQLGRSRCRGVVDSGLSLQIVAGCGSGSQGRSRCSILLGLSGASAHLYAVVLGGGVGVWSRRRLLLLLCELHQV